MKTDIVRMLEDLLDTQPYRQDLFDNIVAKVAALEADNITLAIERGELAAKLEMLERIVEREPVMLTRWISGTPPLFTASTVVLNDGQFKTKLYTAGVTLESAIADLFGQTLGNRK